MAKKKEKVIKGWWFPHLQYAPSAKKSIPIIRYAAHDAPVELAGTPVRAGQVHHLSDTTRPIRCCEYGLHGSCDIADASYYSTQDEVVCRVELWGDVDEHEDKLAARFRRIVRVYRIPEDVNLALLSTPYRSDWRKITLREVRRQDRARKAKAAKKAAAKALEGEGNV